MKRSADLVKENSRPDRIVAYKCTGEEYDSLPAWAYSGRYIVDVIQGDRLAYRLFYVNRSDADEAVKALERAQNIFEGSTTNFNAL